MSGAYYNEHDAYPAQWLRNLAGAGHIAPGIVDERSIADVQPQDLDGYERAHFFAGIGGWDLALRLAGWPTGRVVWTGSCPCQPFSSASRGRAHGFDDKRHLWPVWREIISERRPPVVFGEQVAGGEGKAWLDTVASDFESMGYSFGAALLCASSLGYPRRQRVYFVAHPNGQSERPRALDAEMASLSTARGLAGEAWCRLRRVDHSGDGLPVRVASRRAFGNAIVPQVAATFIRAFMEETCQP